MSSLYNLEPQPTAKVNLQTTAGDLSLELFGKQTPLTTRNFLQHCLDGYYDGTLFHRLVPGFIIQGGDPTNSGAGGESSYDAGAPFADEFHPRLKFNRRGLLGMANTGAKDDNGSQFFFTLGKTEELTGRNTMFGRVVGDTIYNLVKMGEAELTEEEGSERAMYPTKITGTEVLVNPFEDMVKRIRISERVAEETRPKKKAKKKGGKALLSFGEEDGGGEPEVQIKSTAKYNQGLVKGPENGSTKGAQRSARNEELIVERPAKRRASPSPSPQASPKPVSKPDGDSRQSHSSRSPSPATETEEDGKRGKAQLDRANAQIEQLKSSLRRTAPTQNTQNHAEKKLSALDAMVPSTSTRGRRRNPGASTSAAAGEKSALDAFNAFRKRLTASSAALAQKQRDRASPGANDNANDDGAEYNERRGTAALNDAEEDDEELCELHFLANCESCKSWDRAEADVDGGGGGGVDDEDEDAAAWMSHKLSFAKERRGKAEEWRRRGDAELMVVDPKVKSKEIAGEHRRKKREKREERGNR